MQKPMNTAAYKVLISFLKNNIKSKIEKKIDEYQVGFRKL